MDKVDVAIQRLKTASEMSLAVYGLPLIITDSGGKDSSVLVDLAIKAKIPMEIQHSHTTADAPETVYFVRNKFKRLEADGYKCTINKPTFQEAPTSMWNLIPIKLFPPTRRVRYCCDILKEQAGKNRMIGTGVRWAESESRATGRGIYETPHKDKERQIILTNDNDDRRKLFENCKPKAKRTVNPIVDWSDHEVWTYVSAEKIAVNSLYSCGWLRVGCVGCPLAKKTARQWEFNQFPLIENLYRLAFDRMLIERERRGKKTEWKNSNEVFLWWMEDKNLDGQIDMFEEPDDD